MEANTIIVVGVILALLAALSFILMKISSKEYPKEEIVRPKFQPRKVSYTKGVDPYETEKPKRKKKRYYNKKKKPTVANNAQVEKRPVGRPRKVE
jgi:hypothetical protein